MKKVISIVLFLVEEIGDGYCDGWLCLFLFILVICSIWVWGGVVIGGLCVIVWWFLV